MPDQRVFPVRTAAMTPDGDGLEVQTRTLDSIVDEYEINRIDLLKVDVDGYETRVLRGAENTLRGRAIRHAIVEFCDHWVDRSDGSSDCMLGMLSAGGLEQVNDWIATAFAGPALDRMFVLR